MVKLCKCGCGKIANKGDWFIGHWNKVFSPKRKWTDEHRMQQSERMLKNSPMKNPETAKKVSKAMKEGGALKSWEKRRKRYGISGVKNSKAHTEKTWETRRRLYGRSGVKDPKNYSELMSKVNKKLADKNRTGKTLEEFYGFEKSKKVKGKISSAVSELWKNNGSVYNSEEYREKLRTAAISIGKYNLLNWMASLNPKEREEFQKLAARGRRIHPNRLEKRIINICNDFNLPFVYTGEEPYPGLEGKIPDFVYEKSRKIIEVFGDYWHKPHEIEEKRNHYKKFDYDTLILWESEILNNTDEEISSRIQKFLEAPILGLV